MPLPFDPLEPEAWHRLTTTPLGGMAFPAGAAATLPLSHRLPPGTLPGGPLTLSRLEAERVPVGWEISLPLQHDEAVFGGGESFAGVDLRGTRRVLANREIHGDTGAGQAYLNVPFFWSTAGWGMLIGSGAPVLADIGATAPAVARFQVLGRTADLSLHSGEPRALLRRLAEQTGWPGAWPDWGFGTWMSRATYVSEEEIHQVLDTLAAADCPADVVHVDAWLAGNVFRDFTCSWEVDRRRFPAGWTDRLRARGVRTSLWLNSFVRQDTPVERALAAAGLLLRGPDGRPAPTADRAWRHIVDFTNPGAVAWWGERIRRLLTAERPDALKLDFGEEIPLDAVCHDGRTGLELRNAYALLYHRATLEAIPPGHPPVPFFCRAGTAGSQATPCHWVGDTPSTWAGMAEALRGCLSLSLSGLALVSHDGGGFFTPGSKGIPVRRLDGAAARFTADVAPELFGRWVQWAAFTPVTRLHGTALREPTAYPEPWRSAAIAALRLRRRIVPLLRAALGEAQATGLPLMRPMVLAQPQDRTARRVWHQYQLGSDLLVAPILAPGGRTAVWLPDADWEPILGGPRLNGAGLHEIVVEPQAFPVYARPGAVPPA